MAADEKVGQLIKVILEKTKAREVAWKKTSNKRQFLTVFPKYVVSVEGPDYSPTFRLHNEKGETIDEITIPSLSSAAQEELKELLLIARRQALGGDQAVDELLRTLSEKK